jgi:putative DNA primase/helicase
MTITDFLERFDRKSRTGDQWLARCPAHEDRQASLAIREGDDGRILLKCHAGCAFDTIVAALGVSKSALFPPKASACTLGREIATYDYKDTSGALLYQVVRFDPKTFRQRCPDGKGGWCYTLNGVSRVVYRLPELHGREAVVVCEGEKDCDRLWAAGIPATTSVSGAGKWRDAYGEQLKAAGVQRVRILPDNDEPGRAHADQVARSCLAAGLDARIVPLPDVPDKGDVSDYLATHSVADLRALLKDAPIYTPSAIASPSGASTWPTPDVIQGELPTVEPFTLDLLPVSFRRLVQDVTERMQVPMDYPAVALVLCLAGVVNRRALLQPKIHDTGWTIVPNLWGGIIAPPGFMKSPVIQAVTRPLARIQTEWRDSYDEAMNNHARAKEEHELRVSAWKEQFKTHAKKGGAAPDRPEDEPNPPTLRRLILNDATFEAMHQTMSENPAGIFVVRDELTGWLSELDRPGREGERAFCLQAWNGDTGHTIDRIGRGTVHVDACCLSLVGGIQPGRLRSYLVDALHDGPSNDGLIQRFQLLVWPDTAPGWQYVDRAPDAAAEDHVGRILRRLVELDVESPTRFTFAPDAHALFVDWLEDLETRIRADDLPPALVCHLSKYRKLMPALALLFELADRASSDGFDAVSLASSRRAVTLEHAQQAAAWCDYLESHAVRIYSCVVTPQRRAAQELAQKIKARKLEPLFSCRDVYIKGWSGLDTPEAAKAAAEILQDAGWLRDVPTDGGPIGGRPSNRYEVNPELWA